jgi:hypothetical protein
MFGISGLMECINSEAVSAASTGGRFTRSELMTDAPTAEAEQRTRSILSSRHNGIVSLRIVDNIEGVVGIDLGGDIGEEDAPTRNKRRSAQGMIGGVLRDQLSEEMHQLSMAKGMGNERLDISDIGRLSHGK